MRTMLAFVACSLWLVSCTNSSSFSQISGTVLDGATQLPLADVRVQIKNSNFVAATDHKGEYRLDYAPGQFVITYQRTGYFPTKLELNLAQKSKFPAAPISLYPAPKVIDIYGEAVDSARVEFRQPVAFGADRSLGFGGYSDTRGHYVVHYVADQMRITFSKPGFAEDGYLVDLAERRFPDDSVFVLMPDPPGMYVQGRLLRVATIRYEKKRLDHLSTNKSPFRIPIYWEGEYFVSEGEATVVSADQPATLYWIGEQDATIVPDNPFAGSHTLRLVKLKRKDKIGGFTVTLNDAELVEFKMRPLVERSAKRGIGYQKRRAFKIEVTLPAGRYAFCEWIKGVGERTYRPGERAWVVVAQ